MAISMTQVSSTTAEVSSMTADQAATAIADDSTKAKPAVIILDEQVIEGRIQKPEAFYILQRSALNYQALEPKKSFIPKVFETVKYKPF